VLDRCQNPKNPQSRVRHRLSTWGCRRPINLLRFSRGDTRPLWVMECRSTELPFPSVILGRASDGHTYCSGARCAWEAESNKTIHAWWWRIEL
jgi:hypothetical protein